MTDAPGGGRGAGAGGSQVLAVLPLDGLVLFPGGRLQVTVRRPRLLALVEEAVRDNQEIALVAQRNPGGADPGLADLFRVGTVARVGNVTPRGAGACTLDVEGVRRVRLMELVQQSPWLRARVAPIAEGGGDGPALEKRSQALKALAIRVLRLERRGPEAEAQLREIRHPGVLADALAQALDAPVALKQAVLEEGDVRARLERARALLDARRRALVGGRGPPSRHLINYAFIAAVLAAHLATARPDWREPMGLALHAAAAVGALGLLVELVRWRR